MKKLIGLLLALALFSAMPACAEGDVADDETFMTGIVVDGTMNALVVEWTDGYRYVFMRGDDADYSGLANGILIGNCVTVTYSGTIDWEKRDASGVKVISVADGYREGARVSRVEYLEGLPEETVTERYVSPKGYSVWFNANAFARSEDGEADVFAPIDPDAVSPVEFRISQAAEGMTLEEAEAEISKRLEEGGYAITDGCIGIPSDDLRMVGASGAANGVVLESYAVTNGERVYYASLKYPEEAAEGYGARLRFIFASLQLLYEGGYSEVTLYAPDATFSKLEARAESAYDDPEGLLLALFRDGALPDPAYVNSFSIDGENGFLDLSDSFARAIGEADEAGEYIYMGSVVNTFLARYSLTSLTITVNGIAPASARTTYDAPLGMFK